MRCSLLFLLVVAAPAAAQPPPAEEQGALTASVPREVAIAPRVDHTYDVPLEPGRAYHVEIEQLETYLDLRWKVGAHARRINDRRGRLGREEVFWVADAPGRGTLTVGNLTARPGRYRIALVAGDAGDADRARHAAEIDAVKPDIGARREAAARFGTLGLSHRQVRVLDRLAYFAAAQGDFVGAREAAERCVASTGDPGREEERSSCLLALATAVETTGDLDRSYALYLEAIALLERVGDPLLLAFAVGDAGRVQTLRGDYDASEAARRRALRLSREVGDELSESISEMSLGAIAALRGRTEEALASSERGREVARRRGSREVEAIATLNAGIAYGNLGAVARSVGRIREAMAIAEAEGMKPVLAQARMALGAAHLDAGELEAAARELAAGTALAREIGDGENRAQGGALLGWALARLGRSAEAETELGEAVEAARKAGVPHAEAAAYLFLGKAGVLSGRLDEAAASVERAREMFHGMGSLDDEGRALLAQAEIARARGDLAGASARAGEALEAFESVRARVSLADQRARYGAYRREAYDVAVGVLVERERLEPGRGHLARAFALSERSRGRTTTEEIAALRGGTAVPPDLADAHRRTLDRIGHLQRALIAARTGPATAARLERDLEEAVTAEEAARRRIREATRPAASGVPGPAGRPPALAADEALLLYHVGDAGSWLFVRTQDALAVVPMPGQAALRRQVDELRGLLGQPRALGAAAYAAAARRAFETLLAPAVAGRPRLRRLRLVPDGALWEIPFEALLTGPPPSARFADLPYVLRRYEVVYQASAAGTPGDPAGGRERPELVAFADPDLPADLTSREPVALVSRAVFRDGDRFALSRLPCARREARDVAALFGRGASAVHAAGAARESVVKTDPRIARARYLLFSTHALISETMPSQSALVLSLADDGNEDGLLQAHEIDALRLGADLVVLSGCETGLGDNVRGDGLLGLARAFFHAGARRLMASLWKVADCSTAELTVDLFRRLRGQTRPDAAGALRAAKLRLLSRTAYAHPYHWAPFVLLEGPAEAERDEMPIPRADTMPR